jgi:hypothetical protein
VGDPKKIEAARCELAKGTGILKTAKMVGLGTGTVQRLKRAMATAGAIETKVMNEFSMVRCVRKTLSRFAAVQKSTALCHNPT